MIQRYDPPIEWDYSGKGRDKETKLELRYDGKYVLYEDYVKLKSKLEAEINRTEIENWYYEVLELVQYDWWLEIIEDVSEVGKEELIKIFKRAAKEAGRNVDE